MVVVVMEALFGASFRSWPVTFSVYRFKLWVSFDGYFQLRSHGVRDNNWKLLGETYSSSGFHWEREIGKEQYGKMRNFLFQLLFFYILLLVGDTYTSFIFRAKLIRGGTVRSRLALGASLFIIFLIACLLIPNQNMRNELRRNWIDEWLEWTGVRIEHKVSLLKPSRIKIELV